MDDNITSEDDDSQMNVDYDRWIVVAKKEKTS